MTWSDPKALVGLLDHVYAAAVDPDHYETLIEAWETHLISATDDFLEDENWRNNQLAEASLVPHIHRAFEIYERLGRSPHQDNVFEAVVNAYPNPSLIVNKGGVVVALNHAARDEFGLDETSRVSSLGLSAANQNRLREFLKQVGRGRNGDQHLVLHDDDEQSPRLFLVNRLGAEFEAGHALITSAQTVWNEAATSLLQDGFGLSKAELEIARLALQGMNMSDMAKQRGRSPETIRSQMKTVLHKVHARNQADLNRILSNLLLLAGGSTTISPAEAIEPGSARHELVLDDGRILSYRVQGDLNGRPMLFLHGMLQGGQLPAQALRDIAKAGVKLICPSRPGYGGSSQLPDAAAMLDRFVPDMLQLLDHLGVDNCPVIGHMAGAYYAYVMADKIPEIVEAIYLVSPSIPLNSPDLIKTAAPHQQLIMRTAIYAPRMLPLIARAAVALVDNGGEKRFVTRLYEKCPPDMAAISDKKLVDLILRGSRHATEQGAAGFCQDAQMMQTDWTGLSEATELPVTVVHGTDDPVVSFEGVRSFVQASPHRNLVEIKKAGQLLLYSHWPAVSAAIGLDT